MGAAEEVSGKFVVAGGDSAPVFDPAPHALDPVASLVGPAIVGDRLGARCGRGDHGLGVLGRQPVAQMVGVIGAIGHEPPDRSGAVEKTGCDSDIVDVTGSQDEDARPALGIDERVELARAATPGLAERLLEGPPFPPAAERCALICVLSIAARP